MKALISQVRGDFNINPIKKFSTRSARKNQSTISILRSAGTLMGPQQIKYPLCKLKNTL
jgi:hypothetical protein